EGSELLAHLSHIVPPYQDRLVAKACILISIFCGKRNVILCTADLHDVIRFLTEALQQCQTFVYTDILSAFAAVCENNTYRIKKFHDTLVGGQGVLLQLTDDTTCDDETVLEAVRCLAAFCTIKPHEAEHVEVQYLSASFDTFVHLLHRAPHLKMDPSMKNKLLICCFSGIQNIVLLKRLPNIQLGTLFAAVRAYLFFGLTSQQMNIPSQLFPNAVTPYDPLASPRTHISNPSQAAKNMSSQQSQGKQGTSTSPGESTRKKQKKRKSRGKGGGEGDGEDRDADDAKKRWDEPPLQEEDGRAAAVSVTEGCTTLPWDPSLLKVSSSDSEFSDTEGGRARYQKAESVRVRHSALICFLNIVRIVEKKVMFGYWSSFLPDLSSTSTAQQTQSLFTVILKDPSPKCRVAAVASLTCMLEATRNLLAAAQDVTTHQPSPAFTTFSAALGATCREMHRCLLQALVAENFNSVLTQIIKCLANLVSNVPYHRLNPGLLTKVLKQVRHFFNHKDPNVRTACLTCIGAMVGIRPPLMEVSQLIRPPVPPVGVNRSAHPGDSPLFRPEDAAFLLYPSFSTPQVARVAEEGEETVRPLEKSTETSQGEEPATQEGSVPINSIESSQGKGSVNLREESEPERQASVDTEESESRSCAALKASDVLEPGRTSEEVASTERHSKQGTDSTGAEMIRQQEDGSSGTQNTKQSGRTSDSEVAASEPTSRIVNQLSSVHITGEETSDTESAIHNRSGVASSAEGRTPVLAASSGEATPMYRDQTLQSMARETSWVIKFSVKNIIGQPDTERDASQTKSDGQQRFEPLPIRLEALQVISNLVKNYFPVIRQSVGLLRDLIQTCLEDLNPIVQLHGCKVLDEFTQALHREVQEASLAPNHVIPVHEILDFWLYLLGGPLPKLLAYNPDTSPDSNNLVRSAACESMGNVGEEVFSRLPRPRQMQCLTLVLGMVAEDDKLIKAAAVRALGIYILYPTLRDDVLFVLDAAAAILECVDAKRNSKSQTVRFKAAWAMANLCDTLVTNKDNNQEEFLQEFPDSVLLKLLTCAASATRDSDKISCNSGRAIGNLLRFMPARCFLQQDMSDAIQTAVKGLIRNMTTGAMKVRWNSCYAASNVFRNPDLPVGQPWTNDILNMLSKVVQTCSNFKVRINAALGLCALKHRRGYGSSVTFTHVWTSLIGALESSENINDFAEYKYKDSLIEHLCGAVLHVTSLTELSDLTTLRQDVLLKGHSFRTYMEKYVKLDLNSKSCAEIPSVESVRQHLESLEQQATSEDQRRSVQDLMQACLPDSESPEDKPPAKLSFKQIYD
ncbi:hypothetical protein EGW08_012201, partial [Elysia chlorotica]